MRNKGIAIKARPPLDPLSALKAQEAGSSDALPETSVPSLLLFLWVILCHSIWMHVGRTRNSTNFWQLIITCTNNLILNSSQKLTGGSSDGVYGPSIFPVPNSIAMVFKTFHLPSQHYFQWETPKARMKVDWQQAFSLLPKGKFGGTVECKWESTSLGDLLVHLIHLSKQTNRVGWKLLPLLHQSGEHSATVQLRMQPFPLKAHGHQQNKSQLSSDGY